MEGKTRKEENHSQLQISSFLFSKKSNSKVKRGEIQAKAFSLQPSVAISLYNAQPTDQLRKEKSQMRERKGGYNINHDSDY